MKRVLILLISVFNIFFVGRALLNSAASKPTPIAPNNSVRSSSTKFIKFPMPAFRVGNINNIGKRKKQQDSFGISDVNDENMSRSKGVLAVVADGMGGLEDGAAISQLIVDTFLKKYDDQNQISNSGQFLYDSAKCSETAVEDYMSQHDVDGGSTVVAVLIKNGELNFVSVGDSNIFLFRSGELRLLNRKHNLGAILEEKAAKGEVAPDEPFINPRRNALTAYIGMGNFRVADRSGSRRGVRCV